MTDSLTGLTCRDASASKKENHVMWRNVEQNLSCGDISPHDKCGDNFFVTIHADLSQNLLCCHLRCIGAKSILSRFTHFCVEQNLTQTSCPWSTNDKFHVWWRDSTCVFNEYNQAKIIIQMWHYLSF